MSAGMAGHVVWDPKAQPGAVKTAWQSLRVSDWVRGSAGRILRGIRLVEPEVLGLCADEGIVLLLSPS